MPPSQQKREMAKGAGTDQGQGALHPPGNHAGGQAKDADDDPMYDIAG